MKRKLRKTTVIFIALLTAATTSVMLTACTGTQQSSQTAQETTLQAASSAAAQEETAQSTVQSTAQAASQASASQKLSASDIETDKVMDNSEDGGHAITADGTSAEYSRVSVTKTGESSGDEADFYGENAAVFATNGGTLTLSNMVVNTNGTHANGVFSYGEGTTVNISDSYITTSGNCSGGLMTTGGTMNAQNLTIETSGNSSAAIRSDRGGGTVNVTGGYYATSGTGSPVIYSTADITVSDATMVSTASQGVVVEGKNSVTLNNVNLTADNNTKNSDKSDYYQAVMIYQSMSGDAAQGLSSFAMNGGSLVNQNGDVFFVNNTATQIDLNNADIQNNGDGVFLRAAAAGWGSEGSNGGQVTLNASDQKIDGDMVVDSVSNLNLYLKSNSSFTGAVNSDGQAGEVYVEIEEGSTWTLTADSYITSLTCTANSIQLNGHKLYVNGTAYTEGTASTGTAIEVTASSSNGSQQAPPDGNGGPGGQAPNGQAPNGQAPNGTPPAKPGESSQNSNSNSNNSQNNNSQSSSD